jgi:dienelactone hydrolase
VKSEPINYAVGSLGCRGELIYDEAARSRPLLLMAPNWLGMTKANIQIAAAFVDKGYTVFVADMLGEGKLPKGTENPMEFLTR